jgi:type II secretory pathway component GspD/PulD (secretin)
MQIERQLMTPISISFDNTPLKQVLDELRDVHGINIVVDEPALQEAGIHLDSPITIKLDKVSLRSSLNLLLRNVKLTYMIKHDVLNITTEEHGRGKLLSTTYPVADLVIPVESHGDGRTMPSVWDQGSQTNMPSTSPTPLMAPMGLINGTPTGTASGSNGFNASNNVPSSSQPQVSKKGPHNTTEDQLIKLITSTISPRTWGEMGGPGTIEYHPLTMSLTINQTPDIQEQIQDLLAALRRLLDQEVAIEIRLISVSEDFFERIGVNFSMNILTDNANRRFEPALMTNANVFDQARFINAFNPGRFIAGLTPAGTLTPTLDIPIAPNSFFQTVPNYGGYVPGLGVGLAFLSDIQVFLFMEAVQGDLRSNVMQAPKITAFNGQFATLLANDQQPFLTNVSLVALAGGQVAFQPNSSLLPVNSTILSIQPVISADRRFVRMNVALQLNNLSPAPPGAISAQQVSPFSPLAAVFPVVVPIFTSINDLGAGQPVLLTQYIQQPRTSSLSVNTTVSVPDGGTVVMGGLKLMSESRSEYGPPILSKLPYINRLFKNVGYGKTTSSMMMLVTPRIIIQEEEEFYATGFTAASTVIPNN